MKEVYYLEFSFEVLPLQPTTDILLAELADLGFESFEETPTGLKAYIPETSWKGTLSGQLSVLQNPEYSIEFRQSRILQQNWNALWEASFQPLSIGGKCQVRAPFHPKSNSLYDIIIEPKMSFGTGHHETTLMMLEFLLEEPMEGKRVLDMGCGTGVLAILAAMKGASLVEAIDYDPWCYENAIENCLRNGYPEIQVREGDARLLGMQEFDLILANINRNILLEDLPAYVENLAKDGAILLSGFYLDDLSAISEKCRGLNLKIQKNKSNNNWVAAKYVF